MQVHKGIEEDEEDDNGSRFWRAPSVNSFQGDEMYYDFLGLTKVLGNNRLCI